jgi:hypothetical protein
MSKVNKGRSIGMSESLSAYYDYYADYHTSEYMQTIYNSVTTRIRKRCEPWRLRKR